MKFLEVMKQKSNGSTETVVMISFILEQMLKFSLSLKEVKVMIISTKLRMMMMQMSIFLLCFKHEAKTHQKL